MDQIATARPSLKLNRSPESNATSSIVQAESVGRRKLSSLSSEWCSVSEPPSFDSPCSPCSPWRNALCERTHRQHGRPYFPRKLSAVSAMPTFADLPFEMRIAIFEQLYTSDDAFSFRLLDRINYQIITPRLHKQSGFLTLEELHLLATFGRNKLTRDVTVDLFHQLHMQAVQDMTQNPPEGCQHLQANSTVRRLLRNVNGTENERQRALDLLKYVSFMDIGSEPFYYSRASYRPEEEFVKDLLDMADRTMDGYEALSEFYDLCYGYNEEDGPYRGSRLHVYARYSAREVFQCEFGVDRPGYLNYGRRPPLSAFRPNTPCLTVQNGALVPAADCANVLDGLRDLASFMKAVKRLFHLYAKNGKPKVISPRLAGLFHRKPCHRVWCPN
ncbi:hypothetical protein BJ508DRAFT_307497 [Ascobolus immersus RN42]|uniref:Uncharacterized protein n=1 Tax=Ascobolus immersus RN42 TaxID=1160509 RepID=A0A3N4I4H6_ASCIM|nr:hypothetical protein BJ508DRAFT_307497 [Ascobolus immersus RN42]